MSLQSCDIRQCLILGRRRSLRRHEHILHNIAKILSKCSINQDLDPCRPAGAGTKAFCSGGDQGVRGEGGYVGPDKVPRLNVLDLQVILPGRMIPECTWL